MQKLEAPEIPEWITAMLPRAIQRYALRVDAYRMHVMEIGQGRPVLLLHGNPTWGFLYRKVIEALAGEPFRLIVPDLVGLGFSDKPRDLAVHQLTNHSKWLGAALDQLELEGLILVGQDWGGPIGTHALSTRADRARGLVILNTVLGPPKPGFRPTTFHRLSQLPVVSDVVFRLGGMPQNFLSLAQGDRASIRGEVGRAYRYPLRRLRDRAAPLALARMVPDSLEHPSISALKACQEYVAGFEGPAAIVWGRRDPVLGRTLRRAEALLPQAEVTATQAGHFLQEEVPDEIAAAIRAVAGKISD